MKKPVKNKKMLKLSDVDRKVLLDYADFCNETGMKLTTEATGKEDILRM